MALSPTAQRRDDDPPHPNLDGIRFQATTDKLGVIAVPISADVCPPVSFLPVSTAVAFASEFQRLIDLVREFDGESYLATFLDGVLDDMLQAIAACRPEAPK